jgi:hypothetical protein
MLKQVLREADAHVNKGAEEKLHESDFFLELALK